MSGVNPISGLSALGRANPVSNLSAVNAKSGLNVNNVTQTKGTSFADVINDAITKVNDLQVESSNMTDKFISGESDNIHSVIIAGSKADLALQMTLQVRNKVMDAYKEIMNMNI